MSEHHFADPRALRLELVKRLLQHPHVAPHEVAGLAQDLAVFIEGREAPPKEIPPPPEPKVHKNPEPTRATGAPVFKPVVRWTDDNVAEFARMWNENVPLKAIAEHFRISLNNAEQRRRLIGLPPRERGELLTDAEKIKQAVAAGKVRKCPPVMPSGVEGKQETRPIPQASWRA